MGWKSRLVLFYRVYSYAVLVGCIFAVLYLYAVIQVNGLEYGLFQTTVYTNLFHENAPEVLMLLVAVPGLIMEAVQNVKDIIFNGEW